MIIAIDNYKIKFVYLKVVPTDVKNNSAFTRHTVIYVLNSTFT